METSKCSRGRNLPVGSAASMRAGMPKSQQGRYLIPTSRVGSHTAKPSTKHYGSSPDYLNTGADIEKIVPHAAK